MPAIIAFWGAVNCTKPDVSFPSAAPITAPAKAPTSNPIPSPFRNLACRLAARNFASIGGQGWFLTLQVRLTESVLNPIVDYWDNRMRSTMARRGER